MVVRMRTSKGKRNQRRSHHALTAPELKMEEGGVPCRRHYASRITGVYKNKVVKGIQKRKTAPKKGKEEQGADEKRTVESASIPG